MQLGVNIDHIATLRNAREASAPDILQAARTVLGAGADYIVVHLRGDQRHIKDADLAALCREFPGKIHLESACNKTMLKTALKYRPFCVCIVPEYEGEVTTQGGLKFTPKTEKEIAAMTAALKKEGIKVSLFIDPVAMSVRKAARMKADIVELCTKAYSEAVSYPDISKTVEDLEMSSILASELALEVHSGHGLNYQNVLPVVQMNGMQCLNIGFSIIARSVFTGLPTAILEMKEIINTEK